MKETPKQRYRRKHRVRLRAERIAHYWANKEKISAHRKGLRVKRLAYFRARDLAYYYKFRDKNLKIMSRYKKDNREKMNAYARNKKKTDPSFYWAAKMRGILYKTLRGRYGDHYVEKHFGCGTLFFLDHIAAQFTRGMSWDNHGEWEIDHKLPCRAFNCADQDQRRACWHYENMRPLWYDPHKRKNMAIPGGFDPVEYTRGFLRTHPCSQ